MVHVCVVHKPSYLRLIGRPELRFHSGRFLQRNRNLTGAEFGSHSTEGQCDSSGTEGHLDRMRSVSICPSADGIRRSRIRTPAGIGVKQRRERDRVQQFNARGRCQIKGEASSHLGILSSGEARTSAARRPKAIAALPPQLERRLPQFSSTTAVTVLQQPGKMILIRKPYLGRNFPEGQFGLGDKSKGRV